MLLRNAPDAVFHKHLKAAFATVLPQLPAEYRDQVDYDKLAAEIRSDLQTKGQSLGLKPSAKNPTNVKELGMSQCAEKIVNTCIDTSFLFLSAIGFEDEDNAEVKNAIIGELNEEEVNGLSKLIASLTGAESSAAKAKALFNIFKAFVNVFGVKAFIKKILIGTSWWGWFKAFISLVAQVGMWILTDGAELLLQIAVMTFNIINLFNDFCQICENCDHKPLTYRTMSTGDRLMCDTQMMRYQQLVAEKGYTLRMEPDGRLVLRNGANTALWASPTASAGGLYAVVQNSLLKVVNYVGIPIWQTPTPSWIDPIANMRLESFGNAIIYDRNNKLMWAAV